MREVQVTAAFSRVRHNTLNSRANPWIAEIVSGLKDDGDCGRCGSTLLTPLGDLEVILEPNKGRSWPDVLGCGHYPVFVISHRVVEAWGGTADLGEWVVGGRVVFLPPVPRKLEPAQAPTYFWLDGKKMLGARLDFKKSGFVGVKFCPICGTRSDNMIATFDHHHSRPWSYVFLSGSWTGANLFTTDLAPTTFFCTQKFMEFANRHGFSNFRFEKVEKGVS